MCGCVQPKSIRYENPRTFGYKCVCLAPPLSSIIILDEVWECDAVVIYVGSYNSKLIVSVTLNNGEIEKEREFECQATQRGRCTEWVLSERGSRFDLISFSDFATHVCVWLRRTRHTSIEIKFTPLPPPRSTFDLWERAGERTLPAEYGPVSINHRSFFCLELFFRRSIFLLLPSLLIAVNCFELFCFLPVAVCWDLLYVWPTQQSQFPAQCGPINHGHFNCLLAHLIRL